MSRTNKTAANITETASLPTPTVFDQIDLLCDAISCIHGITAIFDQLMMLCRNPDDPDELDSFNGLQMAYALTFRHLETNIGNVLDGLKALSDAAPTP